MPDRKNSWLIKRELPSVTIVVQAHYIKPLHVWGMTCKVNGLLTDHRQSDDVVACAMEMIDDATLQYENTPVSGANSNEYASSV